MNVNELAELPLTSAGRWPLPNPLPPVLPGESRGAYRCRVVPGFTVYQQIKKNRQRHALSRIQEAVLNDPSISHDPQMIESITAEAHEDWATLHPDRDWAFRWMQPRMSWVSFSSDGRPESSSINESPAVIRNA